MREERTFTVETPDRFKRQLRIWSQQFREVVWLDSNDYPKTYGKVDAIMAVDAFTSIETDDENAFEKLKEYQSNTNDWIFGYLSYDLKNDTEALTSNNIDELCFPELFFFQPKRLFIFKGNQVTQSYLHVVDDEMEEDITAINNTVFHSSEEKNQGVKIKLRITKDQYYEKVNKVLEHIHRGDIYEANFCQEFYAIDTTINPLEVYEQLNNLSRPPFATFFKLQDKYALSASPERYLMKQGTTIISQPIKGTAKRVDDVQEDLTLKEALANDKKERSENVMIVDLVRNDLSKTATKGSVEVIELCKVYTFEQVHQMISTITSTVAHTKSPVEILRTTFPMGSMTGAPKVSAMKIIENLEETKRGLYSGAIGYFTPDQDFDFNVVIRSILYNETNRYVSYTVGGAITAKSIPEKEYEECLIKAKALRQVLEQ